MSTEILKKGLQVMHSMQTSTELSQKYWDILHNSLCLVYQEVLIICVNIWHIGKCASSIMI